MFYVTVSALYPSDREIVRLYDDFDAAISFGDIVADTENYRDALRYYAQELENPNVSDGGIFCAFPARTVSPKSVTMWAVDRIAELSANISETSITNDYVGQCMFHGFFYEPNSNFEGYNINIGMMFGTLLKANEDRQKEIQRLRRTFEV